MQLNGSKPTLLKISAYFVPEHFLLSDYCPFNDSFHVLNNRNILCYNSFHKLCKQYNSTIFKSYKNISFEMVLNPSIQIRKRLPIYFFSVNAYHDFH
jgi:hypothetical protein